MKKSQMMSVLCAASMVVSLLTGCGGGNKPVNSEKTEIAIEETKRDSAEGSSKVTSSLTIRVKGKRSSLGSP